ncbi:AAA family ATPase [Pseudodesulfovibrio sp.]|uniref:AAA family ATPase n=1 Tax=unclassified Pseudodesulfovibrio TaxID=2661612 RepID=UPI003B0073BB
MQVGGLAFGPWGVLPVKGPKSVPLIENISQEQGVDFLINRRILGSSYHQLIKSWLPDGEVWRGKVYRCYPFEIVLKDFELTQQEVMEARSELYPMLVRQKLFPGSSFVRGQWVIVSNLEEETSCKDQIDLYGAIIGAPRQYSVRVLREVMKCERQAALLNERPYGFQQIKAVYDHFILQKGLQVVGECEKGYVFYNPNGSLRGIVAKVKAKGVPSFACYTLWRNNNSLLELNWLPYGFEKPYPFFCSELLELHPHASVLLTEDLDIAQHALKGKQGDRICLSWVGGKTAINGLDWRLLTDRKVVYLFSDSKKGRETAREIQKQAFNQNILIDSYIRYNGREHRNDGIIIRRRRRDSSITDLPLYSLMSAKEFEDEIDSCLNKISKEVKDEQAGMSMGELLTMDVSQKEFLVEPFIKEDEFLIVAAPKKTFKSFVALDIAMALACGGDMGGRLRAPKQQRVTFVDAEMWIGTIQNRSKNMKGLYQDPCLKKRIDDNLYLLSLNDIGKRINLMLEEDRQWIETKMHKGTRLLVLDNLGKLIPPQREANHSAWRVLEEWIRKLNARGIAVILVTHMTKNGHFVRGSGKILDDADTIVTLKKPRRVGRGDKVEVHFEGSRELYGDALAPFSLCYTEQKKRFVRHVQNIDEQLDEARLVSSSEIEAYDLKGLKLEMVKLARKQGVIGAKNFKQEGAGPSSSTISKSLKELCDDGLLVKEGDKRTARYSPK